MLSPRYVKKNHKVIQRPTIRTRSFFVYILRCKNGEFYTGCTTDPTRRLRQHNRGAASRFTRSRRPVELAYLEECVDRSAALQREAQIKKLRRSKKLALSREFEERKSTREKSPR